MAIIVGDDEESIESTLAATGLAKILKKYDKRTGDLLRLPFIEKVLTQPFFTTDLISKLVKDCESTMDSVLPFPAAEEPGGEGAQSQSSGPPASAARRSIVRNTVAALVTMQELRRGSSTYGHFSLPPLSFPETDLLQALQLPSLISIQ